MKDGRFRKGLVVSILVLFLGMNVITAAATIPSRCGDVITVDDEGDGDYTSIEEALNNSNPGDTIEVYSGNYDEYGINISTADISLIGIPHELGTGNDTGKPFINTTILGYNEMFVVYANGVTISNFNMKMEKEDTGYFIIIKIQGKNCKISFNNFSGVKGQMIKALESSSCIIIYNEFKKCSGGISIENPDYFNVSYNIFQEIGGCAISFAWTSRLSSSIVSHNVIDKAERGIVYDDSRVVIYNNIISNCSTGIEYGTDMMRSAKINLLLYNEIRDCKVGAMLYEISTVIGAPKLRYNNFIDNLRNIYFHQILPFRYSRFLNPVLFRNYYDDRVGFRPYKVTGIVGIFGPLWSWVMFDWFPAKTPYDI